MIYYANRSIFNLLHRYDLKFTEISRAHPCTISMKLKRHYCTMSVGSCVPTSACRNRTTIAKWFSVLCDSDSLHDHSCQ